MVSEIIQAILLEIDKGEITNCFPSRFVQQFLVGQEQYYQMRKRYFLCPQSQQERALCRTSPSSLPGSFRDLPECTKFQMPPRQAFSTQTFHWWEENSIRRVLKLREPSAMGKILNQRKPVETPETGMLPPWDVTKLSKNQAIKR